MSDTQSDVEVVAQKLRALRASQIELVWPAAQAAASSGDHSSLVELIKVHAAIQAIDFALANRPDPNVSTRVKAGF